MTVEKFDKVVETSCPSFRMRLDCEDVVTCSNYGPNVSLHTWDDSKGDGTYLVLSRREMRELAKAMLELCRLDVDSVGD